jgi:hypothetical protein
MLNIAQKTEKTPITKRPQGRLYKRSIEEVEDENEAKELEISSSKSELELIKYITHRTRSSKEK